MSPNAKGQEKVIKRVLSSMYIDGSFHSIGRNETLTQALIASVDSVCVCTLGSPSAIDDIIQIAGSTASLFVALTLYPEVQRRAQAQIDSVVSRDKASNFQGQDASPVWINVSQHLFQGVPMRQPRMVSVKSSSFQKVCRVSRCLWVAADGPFQRLIIVTNL